MSNEIDIPCQPLFSTPLLTTMLGNHQALNERFKAAIYAQQDKNDGLQKSNLGGWHSHDNMMEWASNEAKVLLGAAMQLCAKYTADIHPAGKRDFQFDANMWANINQNGHSNAAHTHPGCLWSGVYYVDDGHEDGTQAHGELVLEDPRYPMNVMYQPSLVVRLPDGEPQYSQHAVTPKSGMMVMFPSWLRHKVRVYNGNRDRISVAFNLMVKEA